MLKLALAGLLVFGSSLGLASCGSETDSSPGTSPAQTSSNPYTNPIKTEGSSPARLAGDGRYFGYVRAVDAESQPPTLSFDIARFFFGKDVQRAAEEDGAVAPGEPVSNDHYERNSNARAQTLRAAFDVQVTATPVASRLTVPRAARARCQAGCPDGIPLTLVEYSASFEQKADRRSAAGDPVWVTIRDGLVVRIDEQYFP